MVHDEPGSAGLPVTLDDLVVEVARLQREIGAQANQIQWLRERLAQVLPERHYCPFCKALVSEYAKSCAACGRSWGKVEGEEKKGIPR